MSPTVLSVETVKTLIQNACADTPYPGDDALVRSAGDEPDEVVDLFRGRTDWRALSSDFVDRAGAASPSALSFFSAGAFRFYLPAYLIADLDRKLMYTDPLFYLYFGLEQKTRTQSVNVPGRGVSTWFIWKCFFWPGAKSTTWFMRMRQRPGWRSRSWSGMRQMKRRWQLSERDHWKISSGYIR